MRQPQPATKKSEPIRTCVGCRRTCGTGALLRIHLDPDKKPVVGRGPGRGVWICRASFESCAAQAVRSRAFDRGLRAKLDPADLSGLIDDVAADPWRGAPPGRR